MREKSLFRERKNKHWGLRITLLGAGLGALGVVISKMSIPADLALERSISANIALEVNGASHNSIPLEIQVRDTEKSRVAMLPSIDQPQTVIKHAPPTPPVPEAVQDDTPAAKEAPKEPEQSAADASDDREALEENVKIKQIEVESGDSLSKIFSRIGLGYSDVNAVISLGDEVKRLHSIRPGQKMIFRLSPENEFLGLSYDINATRTLDIQRGEAGLIATEIEHEVSTEKTYREGVIHTSLYASAINAGVSPKLVMELAEIFGWKIDFLRDVREGDEFRILYETRYIDGEEIGTGNILAAEFINQGKRFQAVRYTSPDGRTAYYSPDGASLQRGFLRYPVEFSRISSHFSLNRKHPIHGTMRPHRGVDLAAPMGTPVKAAGAGKVDFIGWKNGYGKVIFIQHDNNFTTVYGHLSRFNNRLKRGSRVEKGDLIGYVGMTGDATGPHLHYEFRVNGQHKDPLTVELPEVNPIPSHYRKDFLAQTQGLLDDMASLGRAYRIAQTNDERLAANSP